MADPNRETGGRDKHAEDSRGSSPSLAAATTDDDNYDDFIRITGSRSFFPTISDRLSVECLLPLVQDYSRWQPRYTRKEGEDEEEGKKRASSSRGFFHGPLNNEPRMGGGGEGGMEP